MLTEICSCESKSPHTRQYEHISCSKKNPREDLYWQDIEIDERRLLAESSLIQPISEDSEREDCDGKGVASVARVSEEDLGDDLIVVFLSRCDAETQTQEITGQLWKLRMWNCEVNLLPEKWVECN